MDAHSNSALLHVQKKCISVSISWPQEEQKASYFTPILCKNGFNANLRCNSLNFNILNFTDIKLV